MKDALQSRRSFLKQLALTMSLAALGAPELLAANTQYKISGWTGDSFELGHRLRDKLLPENLPAKADEVVDFVIVGGGVAGLTTAYNLKDTNFLLLEQYDELGGQSRGGTYKGIDFSLGAAYIGTVEGRYGQLYSELGLQPVQLKPADNDFWFEGAWCHGVDGGTNKLYQDFKRLYAETASAMATLPSEDTLEAVVNSVEASKLDATPFASLLTGYSPEFLSYVNSVCKSSFCGDSTQLSALAGLFLLGDLKSTNYVFKGGNSAIPKGLLSKLQQPGGERLKRGAFVWQIDFTASGASVVYSIGNNSARRVDCKHVIITAPPLVAARLLTGLDNIAKAGLMKFRYGSYLVANLMLRKKVMDTAYDSWFGSPFSFADIVLAETPYMVSGSYKPEMGSVMTVYQPYAPGSEGRPALLGGNKEQFAQSIFEQLTPVVNELGANLEEVLLTRWGHAMPVAGPGYFQRMSKIAQTQAGPYTLAHNSNQGVPSAESAIRAADVAAKRAKAAAAKVSMLVGSAASS